MEKDSSSEKQITEQTVSPSPLKEANQMLLGEWREWGFVVDFFFATTPTHEAILDHDDFRTTIAAELKCI